MATSLKGDWIQHNPEVLIDKTNYPRFGSKAPRTRFYIFQELLKLSKVRYIITSQKIPILYTDSFNQWHSLGATRSKLGTKHISYLVNELDIKDTNIEVMADVFVKSIDIDDEKEYINQINTAINLAFLEYAEDGLVEL